MLNINTEGIYFTWVRLKNGKAESEHQVKVSLAKYADMVPYEIPPTISDLFSKTQNHVFLAFQRIKTFQTLHQVV